MPYIGPLPDEWVRRLEANPEYQRACAEIEALDAAGPPTREIDIRAMLAEWRAKRERPTT